MGAAVKRELRFEDCGLFSIYIRTNDGTSMMNIINLLHIPTLAAMSEPSKSLAVGMQPVVVVVVLNWMDTNPLFATDDAEALRICGCGFFQ
jgi:hypothetical protein